MDQPRIELDDSELAVLSDALGVTLQTLCDEVERRPRHLHDVLADADVAEAVLSDADPLRVTPRLLFAVLVHRSADQLAHSGWVADWVGPGTRLPVFDIEPLIEFADAPARLRFVAALLVDFAVPRPGPVGTERLGLDELVDWLDAVDAAARVGLLRQLGDVALFQAGVFPDSTGAAPLSTARAERFGRSIGLSDDEMQHLVDIGSHTAGLDALETLSASWYQAAAEESPTTPVLVRDVAHRIRAARRFLNYVADQYLYAESTEWAFGT
jgi:hypothetical protein